MENNDDGLFLIFYAFSRIHIICAHFIYTYLNFPNPSY